MIALLLRLYPARWRTRYGDEFAALLGERPLGPFDVADVLLGALDAQLHLRGLGSWSEHRRGVPMSLRLGGIAAVAGGALWFAGLVWATADPADSDPGGALGLLGSMVLLVGLTGLSAFQARTHPTLVWTAFALPAAGGVMTTAGLIQMGLIGEQAIAGIYGWNVFILGMIATVVGALLFAIATYRTAALPRSGSAVLGVCAVVSIVSFVVASSMHGTAAPVVEAGLGAFALGWIVIGLQAIRLDRPVMATGAGAT